MPAAAEVPVVTSAHVFVLAGNVVVLETMAGTVGADVGDARGVGATELEHQLRELREGDAGLARGTSTASSERPERT